LDGGIEGAAGYFAVGSCQGKHVNEIRWWMIDKAATIELGDGRAPTIEAEDVLQPADLRDAVS
jgi:hypothetical protein